MSFFFQAEDGIRDYKVTGVQTCALPIFALSITALPVLARVLVDLNLQHHRVGGLSLAAAAFGDGLAWAALTVILAATAGDSTRVVSTVALAAALLVVTQVLVRDRKSTRLNSSHLVISYAV